MLTRVLAFCSATGVYGCVQSPTTCKTQTVAEAMMLRAGRMLALLFTALTVASYSFSVVSAVTDHTYVNNLSSRTIRGTTSYAGAKSGFVNRAIAPGTTGGYKLAYMFVITWSAAKESAQFGLFNIRSQQIVVETSGDWLLRLQMATSTFPAS